jgi:hypothetical protein
MKIKSRIFYWYAAFVSVYAGLLLIPSPNRTTLRKYHLHATGLRGLDVTIIILEAVIWFAAFYGYSKLYSYSRLIGKNKEGKHVGRIARGLLILSVGLPAASMLSGILSIIANHHGSFTATSTIINNYVGVVFPLLAFIWISMGARGLTDMARTRPRLRWLNVVSLVVIALGSILCCLIVSAHKDLRLTYHMSPELVILTLALPYMYIWFLGLFAVAELHAYSQKVVGVVYRKSWIWLAAGLTSIVFLSILIQYLSTLSTWLTKLSLSAILLLLYALLLLLALAYILLALATKQLMKIEEVR